MKGESVPEVAIGVGADRPGGAVDPVKALVAIFGGLAAPEAVDGCAACRDFAEREQTACDVREFTAASDVRIAWRVHQVGNHGVSFF